MQAVDKLNDKYGTKVRLAAMDKRTHKMHQEKLSPQYTTNLKEIINVKL